MSFRILFSLIAVSFLGACASTDYIQTAEQKYPPIGQFVEVEGLNIHYIDEGAGPTVILLHGAHSNIRDWTFSLVDKLTPKHRVIAFDRPGLGYSERAATGGDVPAEQARILKAAADKLGAGKAVIVGHSFGGAVAAAWTVNYQEDVLGLISLAGATYDWGGSGGALYSIGASGAGPVLGSAARVYITGDRALALVDDAFAPNEPIPGYAEHLGLELALRPETFRNNSTDINRLSGHLATQSQRYPEIEVPVVLIHGDEDKTVGLEAHSLRFYDDVPNGRLVVVPGVGHMIHQVSQPRIVQAIERLAGTAQ